MSADSLYAKLLPILLLMTSNVFMTFAWYGHLRFMQVPLMTAILASWGIAFIEYCLAVPANRYGYGIYSAAQLKTIQEVITLLVFAAFSVLYLKDARVELCSRLCADRRGRVLRLSQMVSTHISDPIRHRESARARP